MSDRALQPVLLDLGHGQVEQLGHVGEGLGLFVIAW
jgi:hypothetical protein